MPEQEDANEITALCTWQEDEFALLYVLVKSFGSDWTEIQTRFPKRTKLQVELALQSRVFFHWCSRKGLVGDHLSPSASKQQLTGEFLICEKCMRTYCHETLSKLSNSGKLCLSCHSQSLNGRVPEWSLNDQDGSSRSIIEIGPIGSFQCTLPTNTDGPPKMVVAFRLTPVMLDRDTSLGTVKPGEVLQGRPVVILVTPNVNVPLPTSSSEASAPLHLEVDSIFTSERKEKAFGSTACSLDNEVAVLSVSKVVDSLSMSSTNPLGAGTTAIAVSTTQDRNGCFGILVDPEEGTIEDWVAQLTIPSETTSSTTTAVVATSSLTATLAEVAATTAATEESEDWLMVNLSGVEGPRYLPLFIDSVGKVFEPVVIAQRQSGKMVRENADDDNFGDSDKKDKLVDDIHGSERNKDNTRKEKKRVADDEIREKQGATQDNEDDDGVNTVGAENGFSKKSRRLSEDKINAQLTIPSETTSSTTTAVVASSSSSSSPSSSTATPTEVAATTAATGVSEDWLTVDPSGVYLPMVAASAGKVFEPVIVNQGYNGKMMGDNADNDNDNFDDSNNKDDPIGENNKDADVNGSERNKDDMVQEKKRVADNEKEKQQGDTNNNEVYDGLNAKGAKDHFIKKARRTSEDSMFSRSKGKMGVTPSANAEQEKHYALASGVGVEADTANNNGPNDIECGGANDDRRRDYTKDNNGVEPDVVAVGPQNAALVAAVCPRVEAAVGRARQAAVLALTVANHAGAFVANESATGSGNCDYRDSGGTTAKAAGSENNNGFDNINNGQDDDSGKEGASTAVSFLVREKIQGVGIYTGQVKAYFPPSSDSSLFSASLSPSSLGEMDDESDNSMRPHGLGTAHAEDSHAFEGEWENGLPSGVGIYTFANGNRYAGRVWEGKLHGSGVLTFGSGIVFFEGDWADNNIEGHGRQRNGDGTIAHEGLFRANAAAVFPSKPCSINV